MQGVQTSSGNLDAVGRTDPQAGVGARDRHGEVGTGEGVGEEEHPSSSGLV